MKKLIILILFGTLMSCNQEFETGALPLRQMVQTTETTKHSSGSFFLLFGGYSSGSTTELKVKVFADVGDYYKFIDMDLEYVRIDIDNSVKDPYLTIKYTHDEALDIERLTKPYLWKRIFIIHCPEKYLPKKLLPIIIN